MDPTLLPFAVLAATFVALFVSSTAGYGGSLVLVPVLVLLLGPKEGIALAALLLAWNNVFKVTAYRRTLGLREGWPLVLVAAAGVVVGTQILIALPEAWVMTAVIVVTLAALALEVTQRVPTLRRRASLPLMAASAVVSGTTGSSGPLKGVSIRLLQLPRMSHVGLASTISLVGDGLKASLFAQAGLLPSISPWVLVAAVPAMPLAAWVGRRANERMGERAFQYVFWGVVGGYALRFVGVWF